MIFDSPNFTSTVIKFKVTVHNECDDFNDPIGAWLIGNVLFFQCPPDDSLSTEEDDVLFFYQVTNEQRDKLLSWPEEERDLSVEWVYHCDSTREVVSPAELQGFYDTAEDEDAQAELDDLWSLELDISI